MATKCAKYATPSSSGSRIEMKSLSSADVGGKPSALREETS